MGLFCMGNLWYYYHEQKQMQTLRAAYFFADFRPFCNILTMLMAEIYAFSP